MISGDKDGEFFIDRISECIIFRSINILFIKIKTVLLTHLAIFRVVTEIPHEINVHLMIVGSLMPGKMVNIVIFEHTKN